LNRTSIPDPERVNDLIREVAGEEILPRFQKLEAHEIGEKEAGEIVTAADIETERRLSAAFMDLMPGSAVIGEEAASADPGLFDLFGHAAPLWVIDPVDGTRNFANGIHRFGVIVALWADGQTVAGWLYDPLTDTAVTAIEGQGAWHGGRRLKTARPSPIPEMTGAVSHRRWERLAGRAEKAGAPFPGHRVRYGCTCHEYMDIADGRLHFSEYGILKPWDHLAGILVCEEAGATAALIPDGARLGGGPPLSDRRLLIANDAEAWAALSVIFAD
jgi:fructose-1,6-bisphosphatase/inositol monophosphatase family enzyme